MKYTIKQYAKALYEALENSSVKERKAVMARFLALVRKNGDSPRLKLIIYAFEKEYLRDSKLRRVDIEMASAAPESVKKEIKNILNGNVIFFEKENPALGAGIRITIDGEIMIDASAKRQIEKMFR